MQGHCPKISTLQMQKGSVLSFGFEKFFHEQDALLGQDSVSDQSLGMKGSGSNADLFQGWAGLHIFFIAVFYIGRPVYYFQDFTPVQGTSTHQAGFNGHVYRTFW